MANRKFYAVKIGQKPGIYQSWDEAKTQVSGFSGAVYKSFLTLSEAQAWLENKNPSKSRYQTRTSPHSEPIAKIGKDTIILYTDGGSRNTGVQKGGHVNQSDLAAWAFLLIKDDQKCSKSGGEYGVTNNRMEIMALLRGLQMIKEKYGTDYPILVVSDSKYVLNSIQLKWLWGWKKRGWKKASGEPIANPELWQEVAHLLPLFKHLNFKWTKGHATDEGNVFVDELLNQTMDQMMHDK